MRRARVARTRHGGPQGRTHTPGTPRGRPAPGGPPGGPGGFGLGPGRFYRRELAGPYWFYEGETLGFRTIFAYWPKDDLLITGSVNSRPPNGEDQFGPTVFGGVFTALKQADLIEEQELPATK